VFRVQGAGLWVPGPGFKVLDSGSWVRGSGFRARGSGLRTEGFERGKRVTFVRACLGLVPTARLVWGPGLRIEGLGLRDSGSGFQV
jgi:hypothetical protein